MGLIFDCEKPQMGASRSDQLILAEKAKFGRAAPQTRAQQDCEKPAVISGLSLFLERKWPIALVEYA